MEEHKVSENLVTSMMDDYDFTILSIDPVEDEKITQFIVVHDLHPEEEVTLRLVSKTEEGEEVMNMEFNGPDIYTEDEGKQVLQEVMDFLVAVIDEAVPDIGSGSGSASGSGEGSGSGS